MPWDAPASGRPHMATISAHSRCNSLHAATPHGARGGTGWRRGELSCRSPGEAGWRPSRDSCERFSARGTQRAAPATCHAANSVGTPSLLHSCEKAAHTHAQPSCMAENKSHALVSARAKCGHDGRTHRRRMEGERRTWEGVVQKPAPRAGGTARLAQVLGSYFC